MPTRLALLAALLASTLTSSVTGQAGAVLGHQKISSTAGGFGETLDERDLLAPATNIGDLDGDGHEDLAVGTPGDDDGALLDGGAVRILFMNGDGTVAAKQKISAVEGGLVGTLRPTDRFGSDVAAIGDLDGDGVNDLAVGAPGDDDAFLAPFDEGVGAVWILFLNTDGTVKDEQKISRVEGDFLGSPTVDDQFGGTVAAIGDVDGDGTPDLAVGASGGDDGGPQGSDRGAVYILFLETDGTVREHVEISDGAPGFYGFLDDRDGFGSVSELGDLDRDGVPDLAVGATGDDDGGPHDLFSGHGAVYVLFLNPDGTVKTFTKISATSGGFTGTLEDGDSFGSPAALGDLDGDGITDLAVGARGDDDGVANGGGVWILFLNTDGTVKSHAKIAAATGGFTGSLDNDGFGGFVAPIGDVDGDGIYDLAVGAAGDDDGDTPPLSSFWNAGAVWILFLDGAPTARWRNLASPLAGSNGLPTLVGVGTLEVGDPITLTLSGAKENSLSYLVVGALAVNLPFKGGTLVPAFEAPFGLFFPLPTDGAGGWSLPATWPSGLPAGLDLFFQAWIVDSAAPAGLAASNAIKGTTP